MSADVTNLLGAIHEFAGALKAREERELAKDVATAERIAKLEDANSASLSLQLALDDATSQLKSLKEQVDAATPMAPAVADAPPVL
jgi:hypothetical protein